jgi:hypothetical protein
VPVAVRLHRGVVGTGVAHHLSSAELRTTAGSAAAVLASVLDVVDRSVAVAVAAFVLAPVGIAVARHSPARGRVVIVASAPLALAAVVQFLDPPGA